MEYLNIIKDSSIPLILYAGPLPCWLMFFVIGIMIGRDTNRLYAIVLPIVITIIGFVLSILESNYLLDHYGKGVGIKPSSFLFSAGMILLLFSNKMEKLLSRTGLIYRLIKWVGGISFGIYLIHCYFVSVIVKMIPIDNWLLKWAFVLSATILFIIVLKRILPIRIHKYLGL